MGAFGVFVASSVAASWYLKGFWRESIGWQIGLGLPLLLALLDYALLMIGKEGVVPWLRQRIRRPKGNRSERGGMGRQ
jgi:hypothetical protein